MRLWSERAALCPLRCGKGLGAWYLLPLEERQRLMSEHIRIGHMFPRVKLNTTYSFGIDDQEFVVAFETNYPEDFLDLVQQLREVEISAYTLVSLCRAAMPLFTKAGGGSVMTLTYNAVERVVPGYNSMAIAKAALETCVRYLAVDLGPSNVRINAISAGPLKTLSASAVKGISTARDLMEAKSPLRRNITQEEVGNVAVFLASEMSRSVTGDTIYADNGVNILGVTD